jgi:tetratricopeptide (TPR) repeat protein
MRSRQEQACTMMLALAKLKEGQAQDPSQSAEMQARLRDEARQAYKDALAIDPGNVTALRGLGRVYTQTGNYEQAYDTYTKALTRHPNNADLWTDLGHFYNRRKEWPEAVKCFEKAVACGAEDRNLLMTLGVTLALSGQKERGLVYLTRASSAELAHYYLARLYDHVGQTDQVRAQLIEALRINPNLDNARDWLAYLDRNKDSTTTAARR